MKMTGILISGFVVLTVSLSLAANEYKTVNVGDSEVVFNYRVMDQGISIFTVSTLVYENNDTLRGLRNTDQRRLRKLGQLMYQCRLMVSESAGKDRPVNSTVPFMTSKNYSLITDVDLRLSSRDRVGIKVQSLPVVDEKSLFTPSLGPAVIQQEIQGFVGEDAPVNLKRLSLDFLQDTDILKTTDSVDINVRFPVFQLQRPVHQWIYGFNIKDFKRAIEYTDENCTPARFMELFNLNSESG